MTEIFSASFDNIQKCSERIYKLRHSRRDWVRREVSTFDLSSTAASWIEKTTLDIDCERVREIWPHDDEYIFLPIALRQKGHIFDFDAQLPNKASITLAEDSFRKYYLEYEFYQLCETVLNLTAENIPVYVSIKIREIINSEPINSDHNTPPDREKSVTADEDLSLRTSIIWARILTNKHLSRFIDLLKNSSIIILKIKRDANFSILKISDLKIGPYDYRRGWHFNIFNPIAQFTLAGPVADVTKVIMSNDVRLSRALITYKKDNQTSRISQLDIAGDGVWGIDKFDARNSGVLLGLFAISPKRSQMITTGLILTTLALIMCVGCVWRGVKIDIFSSDKPSTIWTMAIPVIVFIFTQIAVKNDSSSHTHNLLTRKYRTCLTISFIFLTLVCCWDDRSWNNWLVFQSLNSFYPIKWFVDHDIHPGWLTIGLTLAIAYIWTGFFVSYYRARPKKLRNRSYST